MHHRKILLLNKRVSVSEYCLQKKNFIKKIFQKVTYKSLNSNTLNVNPFMKPCVRYLSSQ